MSEKAQAGQTTPTHAVLIGGSDGSSLQLLKMTGGGNADSQGASDWSVRVAAYQTAYNTVSWDRWRNNIDSALLASAARTATTTTSTLINHNGSAITLWLNVTIVPGVDTIQVNVQGYDPASSAWYTIAADAAISTAQARQIVLGLGAVSGGSAAESVFGIPLPRQYRVTVVHSGPGSFTYSLGVSLNL